MARNFWQGYEDSGRLLHFKVLCETTFTIKAWMMMCFEFFSNENSVDNTLMSSAYTESRTYQFLMLP